VSGGVIEPLGHGRAFERQRALALLKQQTLHTGGQVELPQTTREGDTRDLAQPVARHRRPRIRGGHRIGQKRG
jgi:hypothetical protein